MRAIKRFEFHPELMDDACGSSTNKTLVFLAKGRTKLCLILTTEMGFKCAVCLKKKKKTGETNSSKQQKCLNSIQQ